MIQNISSFATSRSTIPITSIKPIKYNPPVNSDTQFESDAVKLSISPEAKRSLEKYQNEQDNTANPVDESETKNTTQSTDNTSKSKTDPDSSTEELSPEEERMLQRLKQSDQDVKTHERQHVAAAGGFVKSGPVYNYTTGPDGNRYAVGGHVSLDMSSIPNNPEATIRKAQVIKRAALAPADPSGADRAVAAAAGKMELKAREQLRMEQEKYLKLANQKGQNSKIKAYTQSTRPLGQAVNLFL